MNNQDIRETIQEQIEILNKKIEELRENAEFKHSHMCQSNDPNISDGMVDRYYEELDSIKALKEQKNMLEEHKKKYEQK